MINPPNVINLFEQFPELPAKEVDVPNDAGMDIKLEGGALSVPTEDGGVTIDFDPPATERARRAKFYDNLAEDLGEAELGLIANELLEAIEADEQSRADWLDTVSKGLDLLGLKLEDPKSAPVEGQSRVKHPILLEAVLRFQANARGELLPATGPVKIRNDFPASPDIPIPADQTVHQTDEMATALETDFNHYLTAVAKEYVPDTDRMLFQVGFSGAGVKKVYNCPIRRRPVAETINPSDFIVHNSATDLSNAGRITHRILMRPATIKRMQIVGAYRDIPLSMHSFPDLNEVDQKIAEIDGINPQPTLWKPEDISQEILECYCELDIPGYEHKDEKGKVTGLRVPYKVTLHKEGRQILEIRRNYDEDDPLCMPREYFVFYSFVPGLGFWPIGLLHILGNATVALTAAWRECLDAGMFASFPGFLYAKQAGRQLTNQFRVPPGGGIGLDVGMGRISDMVMPLPYKEPGAAMINFIQRVEELSQRVGGTAEMSVGEGKQEAPVGTTLALIEQATKSMDAVHKRMHDAQAKEFQLLKERFREDPEAFWRHNKKPRVQWATDTFLRALDQAELVPVADPNNPTGLHRVAKAAALLQMAKEFPQLFNAMDAVKKAARIAKIDVEGVMNAEPAPPPPDPKLLAVQAKVDGQRIQAQSQVHQALIKERADTAKLEADKLSGQGDMMKLSQEMAIKQEQARKELEFKQEKTRLDIEAARMKHQGQMQMQREKMKADMQAQQQKMAMDAHGMQQKAMMQREQQNMDLQAQQRQMSMDEHMQSRQMQRDEQMQSRQMQSQERMAQHKEGIARQSAESKLEAERAGHQQKLQHGDETHKATLQQKKQMASATGPKVKNKAKPKKSP